MELLIGTSTGVFTHREAGARGSTDVAASGLDGRRVQHLCRIGGVLFAGTDDGVYRSPDGGHTWQACGVSGRLVWDIAASPSEPGVIYAGTEPPGLFRSRDGGDTWSEVDTFTKVSGAERWCVPTTPRSPGRARTVVLDRTDPARCWVGVEVGGVMASRDCGSTWTSTFADGNPDIHVMVAHPVQPNLLFATTGYGRFDGVAEMIEGNAGFLRSEDGGATWSYRWYGMEPRYTRPLCIDPRTPYTVTVGCAPRAAASHRDPGGAHAMLYQTDDGGESWRSICDDAHSPSAANFLAIAVDPTITGGILAGTDTGEVWQVSPRAEWTLLARGLPEVLTVCGT